MRWSRSEVGRAGATIDRELEVGSDEYGWQWVWQVEGSHVAAGDQIFWGASHTTATADATPAPTAWRWPGASRQMAAILSTESRRFLSRAERAELCARAQCGTRSHCSLPHDVCLPGARQVLQAEAFTAAAVAASSVAAAAPGRLRRAPRAAATQPSPAARCCRHLAPSPAPTCGSSVAAAEIPPPPTPPRPRAAAVAATSVAAAAEAAARGPPPSPPPLVAPPPGARRRRRTARRRRRRHRWVAAAAVAGGATQSPPSPPPLPPGAQDRFLAPTPYVAEQNLRRRGRVPTTATNSNTLEQLLEAKWTALARDELGRRS